MVSIYTVAVCGYADILLFFLFLAGESSSTDHQVPPGGWTQILLYMGWCEVSRGPGMIGGGPRPHPATIAFSGDFSVAETVVYGCYWMFKHVYGCLWMFIDIYACLWMLMDCFMDVYGC